MTDQRLDDFKPLLRYDSNEGYFADSAAEMTDARGNVLRSAGGETIAEPGEGDEDLKLGFLAPPGESYPNGRPVALDDVLSVPGRGYQEQYREIREKPGYANVIYGRVKEVAGVTWLQYWFWFYYNDLRALDIGLGLHEGDWEGIQLRMAGDEPDLAVYAQHAYGEARTWPKVKKQGKRPVVYVAQGSHASYFDNGMPLTHWHLTEHFIDRADGELTPKSDVRLELLGEPGPAWARWPGRWGDTAKPKKGPKLYREISSGSPDGPGCKPHWEDPAWLLRTAEKVGRAPGVRAPELAPAPPPPSAPELTPQHDAGQIRVGYKLPSAEGRQRPTHLLLTVNSPDDKFPPTTFRLPLEDERGTVDVPLDTDPSHRYELRASGLTPDGALSEPVTQELPPATTPTG